GARLQPGRRGHLRGLVRARPEPRVASGAGHARPRHRGRRAVAHRRLDPSGAGPRRRLGLPGRPAADAAAGPAPRGRQAALEGAAVRLSLSQISTINASFDEDVAAYAAAGFDAIGLWEFKLPEDDAASISALREAGLAVSNCVPLVPSILQIAVPGLEGPADP